MGHEELTTGGWFDPDKSRVLLEFTGWIDPNEKIVHYHRTPTTGYFTTAMRLYATQSGALIRRYPASYRRNLALPGPVQVTGWIYEEIGPDQACDLLTQQLHWKEAQARFPAQFSADLACEWLIRLGKAKDAKKHFPNQYQWALNRVQGQER